ncbi:MAG: pentapeptide repeat-containing protein [Desulfobacterales bacterium]|jgi:uncharacterized protein YjbI with pentapeptide repeats
MAPLREVLRKFNSCPLALPLTIALLLTAALVVPAYPLYRFDPNFRLLLLAVVHGALLSLVLGAFAVYWVAGRLRRRADIADLENTIEDFRGWRSAEAAHRTRGCIRRLNALQTTRLDLSRCCLRHMDLSSVRLKGARMVGTDLQAARLPKADIAGADLQGASLRDAFLWGANLKGATLWSADLRDAVLEGADLSGALLTGAFLDGADLTGADLTATRGLTAAMLARAKGLFTAKLENDLLKALRSEHPHLLQPPKAI